MQKTVLHDRLENQEVRLEINEHSFRKCKSASEVKAKADEKSYMMSHLPIFFFGKYPEIINDGHPH